MTDAILERIAAALERIAPAPMPAPDFSGAEAFVWHTQPDRLEPVPRVSRVDLSLLVGVNRSRDTLLENTATSPPDCPRTIRFCGARAGWGNPRSSRRSMPPSAPKATI